MSDMHWGQHLSRAVAALVRLLPVGREHAFRAYDGVAKAVLGRAIATTNFGMKIDCDLNDYIPNRIFHFGHWEPDVGSQIRRILKDGDVFVDVGANVGYDSLLASGIVGRVGSVIAIEASPRNFEILSNNVRLNGLDNVRLVNMAVSDREGTIDLFGGPAHNKGRSTLLPSRGLSVEARVRSAPLDKILSGDELARVRLIKMDIEGAELPVLENILSQIHKYPSTLDLIIEVSPTEDRNRWGILFDRLKALGYHAYTIENVYTNRYYLNWRRPAPLRMITDLPDMQQDVLFTRDSLDL